MEFRGYLRVWNLFPSYVAFVDIELQWGLFGHVHCVHSPVACRLRWIGSPIATVLADPCRFRLLASRLDIYSSGITKKEYSELESERHKRIDDV